MASVVEGVAGQQPSAASSSSVVEGVAGAALHGMRVDRAVALVADVSRSTAAVLIRGGAVCVDGTVVTSGARRISEYERFTVTIVDEPLDPEQRADDTVQFSVVYSDADVVVVDKPAGLVVHPGAGHTDGTLVNGLLARYPEIADVGEAARPGIVHRLDRDTSGLLVVARSTRAYESLTAQLRAHQPVRVYTALVWGQPEADVGVIEAPIGRSHHNPVRMTVTARGRQAVTHYRVSRRFAVPARAALLQCRLETGRTHQIRVHLSAVGHPVAGDRVYTAPQFGGLDSGSGLRRPFLHAVSLSYRHPATGETVRFKSDLPGDLASCLSSCSVS